MIDVGSTVRHDGRLFRVRGLVEGMAALEGHPVVVPIDELVAVRPCICARPDLCTEALPTMACRAGHIYSLVASRLRELTDRVIAGCSENKQE